LLRQESELDDMKNSAKSKTLLLVLVVFSSSLVAVDVVSAADISACAHKRTGVMRVSKVCKKIEYSVILRQKGLGTAGPKGDRGATGLVGRYAPVSLRDVDATLTAAQLVNNTLFNIITTTAPRALTIDTGANIALAYSGEVLGSSFEFVIWNRSGHTATLAGNVSAILDGTGAVGTNKIVKFLCMFTTITAGSEIVNCRSTHKDIN
jgi:hypothetical protein